MEIKVKKNGKIVAFDEEENYEFVFKMKGNFLELHTADRYEKRGGGCTKVLKEAISKIIKIYKNIKYLQLVLASNNPVAGYFCYKHAALANNFKLVETIKGENEKNGVWINKYKDFLKDNYNIVNLNRIRYDNLRQYIEYENGKIYEDVVNHRKLLEEQKNLENRPPRVIGTVHYMFFIKSEETKKAIKVKIKVNNPLRFIQNGGNNDIYVKNKLKEFQNIWFNTFDDLNKWFYMGKNYDDTFKKKFFKLHTLLVKKNYNENIWKSNTNFCFLIMLCIDQLSRHIYRGKCEAYSFDKISLNIAYYIYKKGWYNNFNIWQFIYWVTVFEHSEDINDHDFIRKILLNKIKISSGKNKELLLNKNSYLDKHSYSIKKFGYYPSRKLVCKKELSFEEKEHLKTNMF